MSTAINSVNSSLQRRLLLGLPDDVIRIIIRHVGPHLNRLACTDKVLWTLCLPFVNNHTKINGLFGRVSYIKFNRNRGQDPNGPAQNLRRILEHFKSHRSELTDYHAGEILLRLGGKVVREFAPSRRMELKNTWNETLQLSLQSPPEQTALVLRGIGPYPLVSGVDANEYVPPADILLELKKHAPAWATIVTCIWNSVPLGAGTDTGRWRNLLTELLPVAPLPAWVASDVLEASNGVAWSAELKPYWFALILASPGPVQACKTFILKLGSEVESASYEEVRSTPKALQYMWRSLLDICAGQSECAGIIAAVLKHVVARMEWEEMRVSIVTLVAHLAELSDEVRGEPAGALIALLADEPAAKTLFVDDDDAGATPPEILKLFTYFYTLQSLEPNLLHKAVLVADAFPDPWCDIALKELLEQAENNPPDLLSETWGELFACLSCVSRRSELQVMKSLLTWPADLIDPTTIRKGLRAISYEVSLCSAGPVRQASLLEVMHFVPEEVLADLPSIFLSQLKAKLWAAASSKAKDKEMKVLQQSGCHDLFQVALLYRPEQSNSSRTVSEQERWNKPLVVMKYLAEEKTSEMFVRLMEYVVTVPQELALSLVQSLAASAHGVGEQAYAEVLALISGMKQAQQPGLLASLARSALGHMPLEYSKLCLKRVLTAAESNGTPKGQVLLAIVPEGNEMLDASDVRSHLSTHPLLFSYAYSPKMTAGFKDRLLEKMLTSLRKLRPDEVSRSDFPILVQNVARLKEKDRPVFEQALKTLAFYALEEDFRTQALAMICHQGQPIMPMALDPLERFKH
jgi:hypothetical protein